MKGLSFMRERHAPQVPMSKFEPGEYINDRYQAIEERLSVSWRRVRAHKFCHIPSIFQRLLHTTRVPSPQIVRKRLNRPLSLAEKVWRASSKRSGRACNMPAVGLVSVWVWGEVEEAPWTGNACTPRCLGMCR
jgi:hypothetical protein